MSATTAPTALVRVDHVSKRFQLHASFARRIAMRLTGTRAPGEVLAVEGASLEIARGEVLGLVGESGCGKSTLGRMLSGVLPPSEGCITLDGRPVMSAGRTPRKIERGVQMVFQNPFASLNPRMKIGRAITEGPLAHHLLGGADVAEYAATWLVRVGLDRSHADRHPHQFSGGQRQRIAIARALAMRPEVLVCDEPVASLDVSIQAQIINLFLELRADLALTMLFISHDLGVVRHLCDRVAVMYLGRIVEIGHTERVYAAPRHPYTRALLESVPRLQPGRGRATFRVIAGEIPSPLSPPSGCHFRTRCASATARCAAVAPVLADCGGGAQVACHYPEGGIPNA